MRQEEPGQIVDLKGQLMAVRALLPPVLDDPGIVHQRVEPGLARKDGIGHAINVGEGSEIRHVKANLRAAYGPELPHDGFTAGAVSSMHEERGPALSQSYSHTTPEPIGGARDQHDLAGQIGHRGLSNIRHGDGYLRTRDPPLKIVAVLRLKALQVLQTFPRGIRLEMYDQAIARSRHRGDRHHSGRRLPIDPTPKEPVTVQAQNDRHRQLLHTLIQRDSSFRSSKRRASRVARDVAWDRTHHAGKLAAFIAAAIRFEAGTERTVWAEVLYRSQR